MQYFAFIGNNFNPVQIDSNILRTNLLENINFNTLWGKIVCFEDFVEFSIFNFKIVRNRKIPRGLTETHNLDYT